MNVSSEGPGGRRCLEAWLMISQPQGSWQPPDSQWEAIITGTGQSQITTHLQCSLFWWWRGPRHWMGLATEFMGWLSVMPGTADSGSYILFLYFVPWKYLPLLDNIMRCPGPMFTDETLIFRSAPGMQLATLLSSGLSTSCPCQH